MTELRVPPDGIIARRLADRQDGFKKDQLRYLRDCLLVGMRGDPFPTPSGEYRHLKAIDAVFVRDRARELLPEVEQIRAGELALPVDPVQEQMDF